MKLQLVGNRFFGAFVQSIGPTLVIVTKRRENAKEFYSGANAARDWTAAGGDLDEVYFVKGGT